MADFDIVALGEPLVELNQTHQDQQQSLQGFGGDTSNAVIAAARQGARCAYLTRVGDDAFGAQFLALWREEGVDISGVEIDATAHTLSLIHICGLWPVLARCVPVRKRPRQIDGQAEPLPRKPMPPRGEVVLKAVDVTRKFGGLVANNAMNLEIRAGEILALIGPNGAGKSTMFNPVSYTHLSDRTRQRTRKAAGQRHPGQAAGTLGRRGAGGDVLRRPGQQLRHRPDAVRLRRRQRQLHHHLTGVPRIRFGF